MTENDLLIRYQQLGNIFDHLSLGVVVLATDRKIISINHSAELLTGKTAAQVAGKYCYNEFLDYLCGGTCRYLEGKDSGIFTACRELEITEQSGAGRHITKIESPIYDADGDIKGCIEVFQDHTAFRKLLRRVKFEDRRLKMILDNLDIGVLTVDRGSHVTFFNTMAEAITGFNRAEVLGKPCDTIFTDDFCRNVVGIRRKSARDTEPTSIETDVVTREGNRIPVQAKCMSLKNEDGRVLGGLTTIADLSLKYQLDQVIEDRYTYYDMVGRDPSMRKIFEIVPVVANSEATVLIEGPTGTGKDLLAKIIHNASRRGGQPLVKVNCAALPDNLLESEMFGYVKGAFTGAERDKPGRFQLADGGTLFLDEIGDLPLSLQAKLLRVLEDREFYPLGSRRTTKVDVRIIAATNQGIERLVAEKQFREDLFYRINVMRLELPPLRQRRGDLPLLIGHILKRLCDRRGVRIEKISEKAMEVLLNHDYPGNVRELENILEHALIICRGRVIRRKHLPVSVLRETVAATIDPATGAAGAADLESGLAAEERERILTALKAHRWSRSKAAAALRIDRTTLWRKMKKYAISR
ncbi:MAG: sigma 54-interacting transcriptional regulator [Desulfobacterales bacterium]|jgi:PAS domain S-box-containing protein